MAELLLELFSEEIPARMQARAADDLARLVGEGLKAAGLAYDSARAFATPRRLALVVAGLPKRSPDVTEERRGPRVGAPEQAIQGFLRGAGLASIDRADVVADARKGDFYVARLTKPGRATADAVADIVPDVVRRFPWPKSMRWGSGRLRWVRPLHAILCLFDGRTVAFEVDGIASGNRTRGHRFMAPKAFAVRSFADYERKLRAARVILDAAERRRIVQEGARKVAGRAFEPVEDDRLLDENAGLTEWPVPLMGTFKPEYLDVPPEVLSTAMKAHQKCFSVRAVSPPESSSSGAPDAPSSAPPDAPSSAPPQSPPASGGGAGSHRSPPASGGGTTRSPPASGGGVGGGTGARRLANRFVLVANLEAQDKGRAIVAGNERVIDARLADAKFFWDQDRKTQLEARVPKLKEIVFHEKLGTQYERVERLRLLARELAPLVGAEPDAAERAAILAKADLVTGMVGEFPELQGVMGRYYALEEGELPEVAQAIAEHYKPQGPSDTVPTHPVSIAVALADKLDLLVGFWAIGETPTGSRDPYGLRRAALGVIRIVLENELRLNLETLLLRDFDVLLLSNDTKFADSAHAQFDTDSLSRDEFIRLGNKCLDWVEYSPWNCVFNTKNIRINLNNIPEQWLSGATATIYKQAKSELIKMLDMVVTFCEPEALLDSLDQIDNKELKVAKERIVRYVRREVRNTIISIITFFADRLKVHLREQGARHDLIDAVFAAGAPASHPPLDGEGRPEGPGRGEAAGAGASGPPPTPTLPQKGGGGKEAFAHKGGGGKGAAPDDRLPHRGGGGKEATPDDLLMIVRRVEALGRFLDTDDGANLLVGVKRAINILAIEEKKDGRAHDAPPDPALYLQREERALALAIETAQADARLALANEDFEAAMRAIARLRQPVDSFFDHVTVNTDEPARRENRLKLLNLIRAATLQVADFSKIEG